MCVCLCVQSEFEISKAKKILTKFSRSFFFFGPKPHRIDRRKTLYEISHGFISLIFLPKKKKPRKSTRLFGKHETSLPSITICRMSRRKSLTFSFRYIRKWRFFSNDDQISLFRIEEEPLRSGFSSQALFALFLNLF